MTHVFVCSAVQYAVVGALLGKTLCLGFIFVSLGKSTDPVSALCGSLDWHVESLQFVSSICDVSLFCSVTGVFKDVFVFVCVWWPAGET